MKRLIALALLLSCAACGVTPDAITKPEEQVAQHGPVAGEKTVRFNGGTDVGVATYRDSTGCEWLIFRYRGMNVSTQPRTEPYANNTQRRQVCVQ